MIQDLPAAVEPFQFSSRQVGVAYEVSYLVLVIWNFYFVESVMAIINSGIHHDTI